MRKDIIFFVIFSAKVVTMILADVISKEIKLCESVFQLTSSSDRFPRTCDFCEDYDRKSPDSEYFGRFHWPLFDQIEDDFFMFYWKSPNDQNKIWVLAQKNIDW